MRLRLLRLKFQPLWTTSGRDVTYALPPSFQTLSYELSNPTDLKLGALFERILRVAITTSYQRLAELWDRTLDIGSWQEILAQYFTYKSKLVVNTSVVSARRNVEHRAKTFRNAVETRFSHRAGERSAFTV